MWYEEGSFVDLWSCDERWRSDEGWTSTPAYLNEIAKLSLFLW